MCACLCSANIKHHCSATVEREPCYTRPLRCAPPAITNVVIIALFTVTRSTAGRLFKVGRHALLDLAVSVKFTNSRVLASDLYLTFLETDRIGRRSLKRIGDGFHSFWVHLKDFLLSAGHPAKFPWVSIHSLPA